MVDFEEYYALGERIHDSLIEIRGLENEMMTLTKMLDRVLDSLDSVDLPQLPERQHHLPK